MKLNIVGVFTVVTVASLIGMVMAGAFGYGAALVAPDLFQKTLVPWAELEPTGAATVLGAIIGVLLGGGLGVFAVLVQLAGAWLSRRSGDRAR